MASSKHAAHVKDFANYVPRFLQDTEIWGSISSDPRGKEEIIGRLSSIHLPA